MAQERFARVDVAADHAVDHGVGGARLRHAQQQPALPVKARPEVASAIVTRPSA
jgi:hypothetical protein